MRVSVDELVPLRRYASRSPLPLGQFPLVRTSSTEEALHAHSTLTAPVTVEVLDLDAPFSFEANRVQVGCLSIAATRFGAGLRASAAGLNQQFSMAIPCHTGGSARQGRSTAGLVPGRRAVLCSPTSPTEIVLGRNYEGRTIRIPKEVIESTLSALTGVPRTDALEFELSIDLSGGAGGAALRLIQFLIDEVDGGPRSPIVESQLAEAFVCGLLTGLPHSHSYLFAKTKAASEPACVRRAEEYIAANAHEHIPLAALAAVTGVAIRTLTAAFRAHRGYSPMAFLRTRRFELARKRLLATPHATVAGVALSCGFEHLGRFSVGYRARFGENASETLRRGRCRAGADPEEPRKLDSVRASSG
jgi:AraC-like DNA-binding protein